MREASWETERAVYPAVATSAHSSAARTPRTDRGRRHKKERRPARPAVSPTLLIRKASASHGGRTASGNHTHTCELALAATPCSRFEQRQSPPSAVRPLAPRR